MDWSQYESVIDKQIREAAERGEFDDLPGTGKPLRNLGAADDELWWLRGYMQREGLSSDALLPTALQLRRAVERLREEVRDLYAEETVREAVAALNKRIVEHLRAPSGPHVPVAPVDADAVVATWRADRTARREAAAADRAADPAPEPAAGRSWWRRTFRRGR
ncbi:DnaJ family domain-containing protein [Actinocatenispora rupis]|uniref:DnaJ homologue subfamily C member 28 conserved domain-containing protein n=1 Tax=Actinocatenispora rupis TaxID=519421 RepID=A0A8J3J6A3_9ACTN|nr:DUF1992 domain-containing protein [Actinocatenispora rupis]GID10854.1 hypothetical protein Aru02nite_17430 [Actinocatenispora rupis]